MSDNYNLQDARTEFEQAMADDAQHIDADDAQDEPQTEQSNDQSDLPIEQPQTEQPVNADYKIAQMMAANQQLQQQIQQLQQQINNQSTQAAADVITDSIEPSPDINISIDAMIYGDENERKNSLQQLIKTISAQARNEIMAEISPIQRDFQEKQAAAKLDIAIADIQSNPELHDKMPDFAQRLPQINQLLQANPSIAAIEDPSRRYITAYLLDRGIRTSNLPPTPSVDVLLSYYDTIPDFKKALDTKIANSVAENSKLPNLSANGALSNATPVYDDKPKTISDGSERLRKFLHLK